MNWDAIGAIGEATGAIAVLITLIYLAVQLRQNTEQARQANMIARADISAQVRQRYDALWHQLSADPQLAVAFNKIMFRDEEVGYPEAARLMAWFGNYCTVAQSAQVEHENGLVDDMTLHTLEENVRWFIGKPLFRAVYREIVERAADTETGIDMQSWMDRIEGSANARGSDARS